MKIKNQGSGLENVVAEIYRDLGYLNVEQNIRFTKKKGYPIHAEIDISYKDIMGNTIYVECKYHKNKKVTFEEYSKFCQVLNMLDIPRIPLLYRAEMITNSTFDERTRLSAEKERIRLIDGDDLRILEEKRKKGFHILIPMLRVSEIYKKQGLWSALDYLFKRSLDINRQIKTYMK